MLLGLAVCWWNGGIESIFHLGQCQNLKKKKKEKGGLGGGFYVDGEESIKFYMGK